jgi:diguanylate cyclase (GGDEF)-like protein
MNSEQKISALEKRLELLQSHLFDAVSQNLRLLSILELTKSNNSIISLEPTLKLLCYQIQETIQKHKLAIVAWNDAAQTVITVEEDEPVLRIRENAEFPKEIKFNHETSQFSGTETAFEYFENFYDFYFQVPVRRENIRIFPLGVGFENKILGFFIIHCFREELGSDEIRLLEACQKQVSQVMQIHYLYNVSNIDSLTGLFNRRYTEEKLLFEMKRVRRHGGALGIILLDIDHFKDINDTYGHPQGDRVLADFGQLLLKLLRDIDIPCRWGGEEFLLVLPATSANHAKLVAERIRTCIAELSYAVDEKTFAVTASLGIADFDATRDHAIGDFVDRVDKALYEAKRGGRNRSVEAH